MKSIFITFALLFIVFFAFKRVVGVEAMEKTLNMEPGQTATAIFAGGCFWCVESDFEKVDGVIEAVSGYTGGHVEDPTYEQVVRGDTGHIEAVRVTYDPARVSYEELLDVFWRNIDPTDSGGQFADRGSSYVTAIFYTDAEQQRTAEASKKKLAASGRFNRPIVTPIRPVETFYPAEDDHQDYYKKNPLRYQFYRSGSGRDRFLEKTWPDPVSETSEAALDSVADAVKTNEPGVNEKTEPPGPYTKPDEASLKKNLTLLQYRVTQENGTEPPFDNEYWDNHQEGIYADVVSGEPLFSSLDKFKSGTGWPSFTRPLEPENVVEKTDTSYFIVQTEVRSRFGNSHLGHLFNDGPAPTGKRYCVNSAALRFIPAEDLEAEGYGQYKRLFEKM